MHLHFVTQDIFWGEDRHLLHLARLLYADAGACLHSGAHRLFLRLCLGCRRRKVPCVSSLDAWVHTVCNWPDVNGLFWFFPIIKLSCELYLVVGWVVLRIYVALTIFQSYHDLEAGDTQSLEFKWRDWIMVKVIIPPATKLGAVYWNHHVLRPSVCLSVRPSGRIWVSGA